MDCTICATERSRREGFSASWVRREAHDPRNPVAGAVARVSDRRWRWVDTKKPFRRARPRFRISLLHFRLRRGYGRGGGTRELSGVAGATPLPRRLACHGGGLGCARHPNPRREVAPGQRSLQEGIQGMAGDHAVPASSADSAQSGEPVLRPLGSGARDTFRYGLVGWERPRSGGEDGAVRLHPPRCRLRHAEMGGRSQPRTRSVDRHPCSAGRGATASVPATSMAGAMSGRTAIPCPGTPKVSRTRRTCHQRPRPAVICRSRGQPLPGRDAARCCNYNPYV